MLYVLRDAAGEILSLHRTPVAGANSIAADHPDVLAFLGRSPDQQQFASMDADLVRVLEDLIDVLIRRNVLCITDLPPEAQAKLFDRKHFREGMQAHSLKLFGDQMEAGSRQSSEEDMGRL
ncbi:MAG: hypothetical protein ACM3VZ_00110 [Acidobacteriota bacterium]